MAKKCDNTSAGIVFEKPDRILLIKRLNYLEAIALPAGHLDGDTPDENAKRESGEEVGLIPLDLQLVWSGRVDNPCKREGGSYHNWSVFWARSWSGESKAGSDAKAAFWATADELKNFARRTEYFMRKYNIPYAEVGRLTQAIFGDPEKKNTDPEWKSEPGLEPVWYKILKNLGKI